MSRLIRSIHLALFFVIACASTANADEMSREAVRRSSDEYQIEVRVCYPTVVRATEILERARTTPRDPHLFDGASSIQSEWLPQDADHSIFHSGQSADVLLTRVFRRLDFVSPSVSEVLKEDYRHFSEQPLRTRPRDAVFRPIAGRSLGLVGSCIDGLSVGAVEGARSGFSVLVLDRRLYQSPLFSEAHRAVTVLSFLLFERFRFYGDVGAGQNHLKRVVSLLTQNELSYLELVEGLVDRDAEFVENDFVSEPLPGVVFSSLLYEAMRLIQVRLESFLLMSYEQREEAFRAVFQTVEEQPIPDLGVFGLTGSWRRPWASVESLNLQERSELDELYLRTRSEMVRHLARQSDDSQRWGEFLRLGSRMMADLRRHAIGYRPVALER